MKIFFLDMQQTYSQGLRKKIKISDTLFQCLVLVFLLYHDIQTLWVLWDMQYVYVVPPMIIILIVLILSSTFPKPKSWTGNNSIFNALEYPEWEETFKDHWSSAPDFAFFESYSWEIIFP